MARGGEWPWSRQSTGLKELISNEQKDLRQEGGDLDDPCEGGNWDRSRPEKKATGRRVLDRGGVGSSQMADPKGNEMTGSRKVDDCQHKKKERCFTEEGGGH